MNVYRRIFEKDDSWIYVIADVTELFGERNYKLE